MHQRAAMISLDLGEGLALVIPEQSHVAKLLKLSPVEAMRRVRARIDARVNGRSLVDDWLKQAIAIDPAGRIDEDELFVDYFGFVQLVAGREADRLSFKGLARALDERGFVRGRSQGRAVRIGCRFVGRSRQAARSNFSAAVESAASVEAFLAARCSCDPAARVRSSVLFEAYCVWCHAEGHEPCTTKEFPASLLGRGLKRKHSNGRWWLGLRLLPTPLLGGDALSSTSDAVGRDFSGGAGTAYRRGLFDA